MVLLWFPYGLILCFFACPENSYDFIWFCYGPGVLHFLLMKFVMAGRIFFCKKIIWSCFGHFRMEKNINYLYLKNKKI